MTDSHSHQPTPQVLPEFSAALDELVAVAKRGHSPGSALCNPPDAWLVERMREFGALPDDERAAVLDEWRKIDDEGAAANAEGKAAERAGPEVVARLNSGGLAFYSQRGVARQPALTRYLMDGFPPNRDSLEFGHADQRLFTRILPVITAKLAEWLDAGEVVVQSDRRICDAPGRSFHARQLIVGARYPQLPYFWRQLTFDLPESERANPPDIVELSIPEWLETLDLPADAREQAVAEGLTRLVFKAPTRGLSLHLGFDYVGEHKMGPLSIAMHQTKTNGGLALQAALSVARVRSLDGTLRNAAVVTTGPSLHGKSTLTIMIELAGSDLAGRLSLPTDPEEGVYPMNDDIILLQRLAEPAAGEADGRRVSYAYGIDGTENNFYAVPSGLTREDDPVTYDVARGAPGEPNPQETLENVVVDPQTGEPDFSRNPTRNMRMVLSRRRLLRRKGVEDVIGKVTGGALTEAAHVPLERMDRIVWQAVMRENTVVPPLRKLNLEQYLRVLMYGEAVQMGAAAGTIGRPYVEYFSDPFIIGLEDDNANILYDILRRMEADGARQEFYAFNTGGLGADANDAAEGELYRKIPREITLALQEAVLRDAAKFEYDPHIGSSVAVAVVDAAGNEALDLREEWLPRNVYGEDEYVRRINLLRRRRYYGSPENERTGIMRYTKVRNALVNLGDVPPPRSEWEAARLLSFYWSLDRSYETLAESAARRAEGERPPDDLLAALSAACAAGAKDGLALNAGARAALRELGVEAE